MRRAIVTGVAGTTRDVLDEKTSMAGVPVRLIDNRGLREAADEAERIAVDRAREALQLSDVALVVLDGAEPLTDGDRALLAETETHCRIVLLNKCDLPRAAEDGRACRRAARDARTGEGLPALCERIVELAVPNRADAAYITNERHLHALERAAAALGRGGPARRSWIA